MKKRFPLFVFFSIILLSGCQDKPLYTDKQVAMGTFCEVISPDKNSAKIVFAEIKRIENLLSKYYPESEISKLNKSGKLIAGPETYYILKKSHEFWKLSGGAFDITVAPLLDLWGFTEKQCILPKKEQIKAALKLIGSEKIYFNDSNNMVEFTVPGMKVDLGAIAKGYALDCAINKLKESGVKSCLINLGGQIYCLGSRFGRPWRIAIRDPRAEGGTTEILDLTDKGVATSGDYEQYFIDNNKRYSHIFNPKTGYPSDSGVIGTTIISERNLDADALSTAVFVMGKNKGREFAKRFPGIEIKILEENDQKRGGNE